MNPRQLVLYVDDDPDCRDTIRAVLESNGFSMVEAHTAEEGLRVFEQAHPGVVVIDLMMEEVDAGVALARDIRARSETPVYMLSSVGDMLRLSIDRETLGVEGILQKPVAADTLIQVLRSHAARPAHA
ncbi:MAG: response regulator [Phycisphaeraceae bacterium]|nr:MAG: response regulator [Phycisphaeraceae bacterium]